MQMKQWISETGGAGQTGQTILRFVYSLASNHNHTRLAAHSPLGAIYTAHSGFIRR
jgi:hypothetical protein